MYAPEQIADVVRRVAEQVARGGTRTQRDEFVADALTELFIPRAKSPPRIVLYDPAVGELEPWLATTLGNVWVSRVGRGRCQPAQLTAAAVTALAAPLPTAWASAVDYLGLPFSSADEARIESWSPRERVELLAISGLDVKLPDPVWERYLVAAAATYRIALPRPFPPLAALAEEAPTPGDRIAPLAAALGLPANTLSQRWKRTKPKLNDLDFIRGLLDHDHDRGTRT